MVLVSGHLVLSQLCPGSQEGHPCPGGHWAGSKKGLTCSTLGWGSLTPNPGGSFGHRDIKKTSHPWPVSKGTTQGQGSIWMSHTKSS